MNTEISTASIGAGFLPSTAFAWMSRERFYHSLLISFSDSCTNISGLVDLEIVFFFGSDSLENWDEKTYNRQCLKKA